MQSGSFCWYELGTTDPEGAKKFYGDLFGWTFEDTPMPGDHPGVYTMIRLGGNDLGGLFKLEGPMFEGVPSNWGAYVMSDDVDKTAVNVKEFGGEIGYEPMDVPGVGRMVMFKGPEGAMISAFKWAEAPGGEPCDKSLEGAFCWSELLTTDVPKSMAFYTKLFAWTTEDMTGDMHYTMFKNGEEYVGGIMEKPEMMGDAPSFWSHYLAVKDCDAKSKQAAALGATIIVPPMPVENMGIFSTFADPQGAVISIWQSTSQG